MADKRVSIIITTKNEEANIQNCLESIKKQGCPQDKIEIIVVDNNSKDKTVEIVQRYTNKIYNFGPERSAQRNFGVSQASGKYILYLDADMVLSKDVIKECVNRCENKGYVALYIPERIIGKGFWIKVRDFERSFYNGTCIDAVRFVRRDKFLEIGGFDENLTGPEDWDFDRRIRNIGKASIIYSPIYHNEGEFNLKKYLKKKSYYSKNFDRYIKKWGGSDEIEKKQVGFCYRYFGVFAKSGKWKRLLKHPVLTLGMFILRFLVGLRYLWLKNY
jgi:glycosyltransferase involved in cell wall biosynthesis